MEGVVKDMSKSYLFGNDYSQRNSTGGDCEGQGTETILLILIGTFKPRRTPLLSALPNLFLEAQS